MGYLTCMPSYHQLHQQWCQDPNRVNFMSPCFCMLEKSYSLMHTYIYIYTLMTSEEADVCNS